MALPETEWDGAGRHALCSNRSDGEPIAPPPIKGRLTIPRTPCGDLGTRLLVV
jgi:hypothetical protein